MKLRDFLNGTHLVNFHRQRMKSNDVIDLLEHYDMDVIYNFDRLHEGTPDQYSASTPAEGFEVQFDEHQILETIWCYVRPQFRDGALSRVTLMTPWENST